MTQDTHHLGKRSRAQLSRGYDKQEHPTLSSPHHHHGPHHQHHHHDSSCHHSASPLATMFREKKITSVLLIRGIVVLLGAFSLFIFLFQANHSNQVQQNPTIQIANHKRQLEGGNSLRDQIKMQIKTQQGDNKHNEVEKEAEDDQLLAVNDDEEHDLEMAKPQKAQDVIVPGSNQIEYDFSKVPPPGNLTMGESFGACLLIKDDNHWLIEWLAYHYHVLPLRHMIVAVDPASQTSPKNILSRWTFYMKIKIWSDKDFIDPKQQREKTLMWHRKASLRNFTDINQHRFRQNSFYLKCMKTLKAKGVTWVQLTDTDEFTSLNYASGYYYNLTKYHPIQSPGSVLRFLQHYQNVTDESLDCLYVARYSFGSKESTPGVVNRNVPKRSKVLKGRDFLTQRFVYRDPHRMANGKNIMNLQALEALQPTANVHRVSLLCPTLESVAHVNHVSRAMIKIHHYLGTEEQYLFRNDPRATGDRKTKGLGAFHQRNLDRYHQLSQEAIYSDTGARGWITGFVQQNGLKMAEYVLHGVGKVD